MAKRIEQSIQVLCYVVGLQGMILATVITWQLWHSFVLAIVYGLGGWSTLIIFLLLGIV